jgi:hypothetical protein
VQGGSLKGRYQYQLQLILSSFTSASKIATFLPSNTQKQMNSVQGLVGGGDDKIQQQAYHTPIQQSFDQQFVLSPLQTKMRGDL